jgi:IclR family transcriptional regulator, acetate operon repressor
VKNDMVDEAFADQEEPVRPNYPIESVDNALRLLMIVAKHGEIRVSQAGAELGTAVSTAHRLLAMLQYHGLVYQHPVRKTYSLGQTMVRIGLSAVRDMSIRTQARPFLESLWEEVDETVHLAMPQGKRVLYVDSIESRRSLCVTSRIGTLMWAHCTSAGKAYLAYEDKDRLLALYPAIELPGLASNSITSRTRLLAELEQIRDRGYATSADESEEGVGSLAVAIPGPGGRAVACVSVAAPLTRLSDERRRDIAMVTKHCAEQITSALAWPL